MGGGDADAGGVVGLDVVGAQQLGLDRGDVLGTRGAVQGQGGGDGVREGVGQRLRRSRRRRSGAACPPRAPAGSRPRRAPRHRPRRPRRPRRSRPRRPARGSRARRASRATGSRSGRPRPAAATPSAIRRNSAYDGAGGFSSSRCTPLRGGRERQVGVGRDRRADRRRSGRRWSRGARRSRRTARARRGRPGSRPGQRGQLADAGQPYEPLVLEPADVLEVPAAVAACARENDGYGHADLPAPAPRCHLTVGRPLGAVESLCAGYGVRAEGLEADWQARGLPYCSAVVGVVDRGGQLLQAVAVVVGVGVYGPGDLDDLRGVAAAVEGADEAGAVGDGRRTLGMSSAQAESAGRFSGFSSYAAQPSSAGHWCGDWMSRSSAPAGRGPGSANRPTGQRVSKTSVSAVIPSPPPR